MVEAKSIGGAAERQSDDGQAEVEGYEEDGFFGPGHL